MKKRSIILTTFMGLAIGITGTFAATNSFPDVPANHWAKSAVDNLTTAGVINGYKDGTFKGDNNITRYEAAVIVDKNNTELRNELMDRIMFLEADTNDIKDNMADIKRVMKIEEQFGQVEKVYESNGQVYIDFDDLKWLGWIPQYPKDKDEIIADIEKNDPGACDVEQDCMPPDGYYLKNETTSVVKINITNAEVETLHRADVSLFDKVTAQEFMKLFNEGKIYGNLFHLILSDGEVKLVREQYST